MTEKLQSQIESFRANAGQKLTLDGIIIEVIDLTTLELDPQNAMAHPQPNRDATRKSLEQNGYTKVSIVAWEHNRRIYAGNLTTEILIEMGFTHAPIAWKPETDATEWEMERFGIQDNQSAKLATWHIENLDLKIETLKEFKVEPIDLGFTELDLGQMFNTEPPEVTEDDPPEVETEVISQTGDLWTLGNHRLICGDCTENAVVERLMDGDAIDLLFTSPPYLHQRDYENPIDSWDELMNGAFSALPMKPDGQILVNLGIIYRDHQWVEYWRDWLGFMEREGYRRFGWYVWDKLAPRPNALHGRLTPSFEWVFHFNRVEKPIAKWIKKLDDSIGEKGRKKKGLNSKSDRQPDGTLGEWGNLASIDGLHKQPDSVIRMYAEQARGIHTKNHPAVFPVALPAFMMNTWTHPNDICYDPFMGSGTSIIAGQDLNRNVRGIEISGAYIDVCVRRFHAHSPDAEITCERDGQVFTYQEMFHESN